METMRNEYDGYLVTIEGIDGSGKTSVAHFLHGTLGSITGLPTVSTSEPSKREVGQFLRKKLADEASDPLTDFFLFMADRVDHINSLVKPALEDGQVVISDRYADSTRAYQPVMLQDSLENPEGYIRKVMDPYMVEPDITVYLDVGVDVAMERADLEDKYESEETLHQVRDNYVDMMQYYYEDPEGSRFIIVNAERPLHEVKREVLYKTSEKILNMAEDNNE